MFLAQGPQRSDAGEAHTRGPWSRVKYSTTEPLRSLDLLVKPRFFFLVFWKKYNFMHF